MLSVSDRSSGPVGSLQIESEKNYNSREKPEVICVLMKQRLDTDNYANIKYASYVIKGHLEKKSI